MSQQQVENSGNDLLLRSLEPNTNGTSTSSTSSTSSRLPLRKRIGPILKWQPVETPEEHYKPKLTYPNGYPEDQYFDNSNEIERGGVDTTETDEEKIEVKLIQQQKKIKQENGIKRSNPDDNNSSNHSSPSNNSIRPTKKVKRGRPPLQKVNSSNDSSSLPTTPTTPSTPAAAAAIAQSLLNNTTTTRAPPTDTVDSSVLYCICKRPYDVPRFMIACDKCDQWFHGECIQISEKQGEFIDLYFCEACAKITGKKTSWKPQCANPTCEKAARIGTHQGNLSKYCTDSCGMQVAHARIDQAEQLKKSSSSSSTPISTTNSTSYNPLSRGKLSSFADLDDRSRLSRVKDEKLHAKFIISIGEHKSELLSLLIQVQQLDVCGFDTRLAWPDTIWEKVAYVEKSSENSILLKNSQGELINSKTYSICQQQAKKCNKHTNWQRLKLAELEQERSEQFVILTMLERERQQIKARMKKRREEVDLMDFLENGTINHYKYL